MLLVKYSFELRVRAREEEMINRIPKFKKGDRVRINHNSASPYRGCSGVVERVVEEKSGLLYIVQFGKSGDLTRTDNFLEDNLQTIGS